MTPEQFIAKWQAADLKERAAAQSHFNDLCELLDEPKPTEVTPLLVRRLNWAVDWEGLAREISRGLSCRGERVL